MQSPGELYTLLQDIYNDPKVEKECVGTSFLWFLGTLSSGFCFFGMVEKPKLILGSMFIVFFIWGFYSF